MSENISIKLPSLLSRFIAKLIFLVCLGALSGYYSGLKKEKLYLDAQKLTQADYSLKYESYKAHIFEHHHSLAHEIIIGVLAAIMIWGIFEIVSIPLAFLIDKILSRKTKENGA